MAAPSTGFSMVPPPGLPSSPFTSAPQATGIPPPAVLTVPIPGVLAATSGVSTPPSNSMMMMNTPSTTMFDSAPAHQADQTGPVFNGPGAEAEKSVFKLCKTSMSQTDQINRAKKYAMEQSIKTVLVKQTIAHQAQQQLNIQTNVQKQQALALMCRIYVGSINFEIKEDTIKQAFQPFGPIKSVNLSWDSITNKHKGFAFVEYDIPEAASLAMEQMNGVMIGGRNIKVGRPTNMPQAQPIIEQLKEDSKGYNRIYIASIHPDLVVNDVKSVFEAFGPIRACQLVPEPTRPGRHKGYGFIEYTNAQSAEDAVSSMNLFDLGGMFLRVGKAITPPDVFIAPSMTAAAPAVSALPTASAIAAAAVTAKLTALEAQQPIKDMEKVPPPAVVKPEPQSLPSVPPPGLATTVPPVGLATPSLSTNVPVAVPPAAIAPPPLNPPVINMGQGVPAPDINYTMPTGVSSTMTTDQPPPTTEDNTIGAQENMKISGRDARHMVMQKLMRQTDENEVESECSRYGSVERVIIYQERQGEEEDAEVIVKIFVEFTSQSEVERAVAALNGRYFGGRIVKAEKYNQDLYQAKDFSG
ncbi:PUF60 [Bugula neritina]|uniref:PUF60 n=1 Tax=Bugula neritina TaxID=10212 RepID=A0A7J7JLC5_BUGNE|nr:PUF60 [Bugula neritina]